jgi:O-antigen ligase
MRNRLLKAVPTSGARSTGVLIAAAVLCAAALALMAGLRSALPLFLPAAVLATLLLARGVFSAPVTVLTLFLLVVVNLDFVKLGSSRITLDIAFSAALLWVLVVRVLLEGRRLFGTALERVYLVFLAVTLLSTVLGVSPLESIKRWGRDLEHLIVFAFLFVVPLTLRDRRKLVGATLLSSIFPCVVGLIGLIFHIPALLGAETPIGGGAQVVRIAATLSHPVSLALYLSLAATLTLSFLWDGRWFSRRWLTILLALQLVTMYLTFARTGWLAFIVSCIALVCLRGRARLLWIATPTVALAIWRFLPTFVSRWSTALVTSRENSFLWRVGLWIFALRRFPERPIFGSGPGTFLEYISYQKGYNAHQTWVGLLIETGLVGTLAFLVLLITIGRALIRRRAAILPRHDPLREGMLAIWIGFAAVTFGTWVFALPSVMVCFWALTALALRTDDEGSALPSDSPDGFPDNSPVSSGYMSESQ